MVNVKETLSSKAVTKKESREVEGLMARGRSEKKETNKGKQKRSKSRPDKKNKPRDIREKTRDAVVATESIESDNYDSIGVLIVTNNQTRGNWALDSGCSLHMCPNKNLFINYEAYDGGVVVMGNDAICKVVGRDIIRLKMFDGLIRELVNVRHVPDLKRNLISLGMLDKIGCLVKLESCTLKVMRGSMVLMKGDLNNGLYVLQGTAVIGDVGISNQKLDKTMLWHLRLSHMSEK